MKSTIEITDETPVSSINNLAAIAGKPMKSKKHPGPFGPDYYRKLVLDTRTFGHCYLHVAAPSRATFDGIEFVVTGYGRSLISGGHKYKAYAYRDWKVIRSKELRAIRFNHETTTP